MLNVMDYGFLLYSYYNKKNIYIPKFTTEQEKERAHMEMITEM